LVHQGSLKSRNNANAEHPDLLLSNLDACAEIQRAAASAPGAVDVCHLPVISVGSYPGDIHSKDLSYQQVWQLLDDGSEPGPTEHGHTKHINRSPWIQPNYTN
jgi:hypothetical protein